MDPSEKERYEIQVRESCIQLAMHQFNDGRIPFNMAISRAESLSQFILHGINPDSPAPEPSERDATHNAKITYPFTDATGNKFRLEQDGKGNLVFRYEDGTATTCPLSIFPEAPGE